MSFSSSKQPKMSNASLLLCVLLMLLLVGKASTQVPNFGSGADGDLVVAKGSTVQEPCFYLLSGVSIGGTTIQLSSCAGVTVGVELLLHQTQAQTSAGKFSFVTVAAVNISCHVTTVAALPRSFSSGTVGGNTPSMTQIVIVRQYTNVYLAGTKTSPAWNGLCGGIFLPYYAYLKTQNYTLICTFYFHESSVNKQAFIIH